MIPVVKTTRNSIETSWNAIEILSYGMKLKCATNNFIYTCKKATRWLTLIAHSLLKHFIWIETKEPLQDIFPNTRHHLTMIGNNSKPLTTTTLDNPKPSSINTHLPTIKQSIEIATLFPYENIIGSNTNVDNAHHPRNLIISL